MCGRLTVTSKDRLIKRFNPDKIKSVLKSVRFNICPSASIPGLIEHQGEKVMGDFQWGLIAPWVTDVSKSKPMINARLETIHEKPTFRDAFAKRRCLILIDGFYEWNREGKTKIPYYFHMPDREPFAFAGLYEVRPTDTGGKLSTCTIITTEADELMTPIHHRMPVILDESSWSDWLEPGVKQADDLRSILSHTQNAALHHHEVNPLVNSPANDSEDLIKPATRMPPEPDLFG